MGVRLERIITAAKLDSKITDAEVDGMLAEVKRGGVVSKAERKQLSGVLTSAASMFEAPAKAKLSAFLLGGPPPPPPPPPAQTAEQLLTEQLEAFKAGGFTGSELNDAERAIAARYGDAVAKQTLEAALGARTGELTVDGVTWLQQKHGSMEGQINRFQQVLETHLKDAKLLDANFDGKLDENDKIFTVDASGKIDVQSVGAALRDRMRIGAAMVGACEDMDRAGHSFALIKDQTFSADCWTPSGNGAFALKPGVKPSDAVADIFANPSKYKFECATALVIVHYKAMLDLLGPKDFDAACASLRMGPWVYESTMAQNWNIDGSGSVEADAARQSQLRAGDYTYFKNWEVSDTGRAAGWQGENVISLGGGRYYGHPFGIENGDHIVAYLNQNRNAGSTRSASMLQLQARLNSNVLLLDRQPG